MPRLHQGKAENLYDPRFVSGMFDRMSKTYGLANLISSFGFTAIWRKQCIKALPEQKKPLLVYDLMSGMGEAWPTIQKHFGSKVEIIGLDISEAMNQKATEHKNRLRNQSISVIRADVLKNNVPAGSADVVVSTFGLKTFNREQLIILAREVNRILKPGGQFSFIEISEPEFLPLKVVYMLYLNVVIPMIGFLFLGNSQDYRMLGVYCSKFKNSREFMKLLRDNKLEARYGSYFFGCASGVSGRKIE